MNTPEQVPADDFLDQAISALTRADAAELERLEFAAPTVAPPVDRTEYLEKRAIFAASLAATARNLRLLRRIEMQHTPGR